MTGWVYLRSEASLWTVGFYAWDGAWHPDSDHDSRDAAAERVRWLNGGDAHDADAVVLLDTYDMLLAEFLRLDPRCERSGWDTVPEQAAAIQRLRHRLRDGD